MESRVLIDSINFFVRHEGEKDKPLVVLCHALMANHHMWDYTISELHSAGYSTLRYDHVGHNRTTFTTQESASNEYHFDDFTRHIHELVEFVTPGRPPFALLGCSMGGVLALRYAQMYPGRVKKIISCDAPGMASLSSAKQLWKDRIDQFKAEGVGNLARTTVDRWLPDPCPARARAEMLEQTSRCSYEGYRACAKAIMNYDYDADLEKIHTEDVMILAGQNDSAIGPRDVLINVAEKIQGSKYVLMEDVGHIPPFHNPDSFNKIMAEFLTL